MQWIYWKCLIVPCFIAFFSGSLELNTWQYSNITLDALQNAYKYTTVFPWFFFRSNYISCCMIILGKMTIEVKLVLCLSLVTLTYSSTSLSYSVNTHGSQKYCWSSPLCWSKMCCYSIQSPEHHYCCSSDG